MLDYRLHTFVTLYKELNYRRTAELLNMTQPGVTKHIQYLECYYGVKLFVYDGRQLHRTQHADMLKMYADNTLARERSLKETFVDQQKIHLDVGFTKTIGEFVFPPIINRYLADPYHSLDLSITSTTNLLQMLEDSKLDFAVVEGVFDKRKYGYHLYAREHYVGMCAKNHPFAGKTLPLKQVLSQTLLIQEPGSGTRRLLEQTLHNHGFSLNDFARCICVSNFSIIRSIVSGGNAISFGYMPVVQQNPDLSAFYLDCSRIIGEFNFIYCDESTARPKIDLLLGTQTFAQ